VFIVVSRVHLDLLIGSHRPAQRSGRDWRQTSL